MEQPSAMWSMGSEKIPVGGFNKEMGGGVWKIFSGMDGAHALINIDGANKTDKFTEDISSNSNKTTPDVDSDDAVNRINGIRSDAIDTLLPNDVDALFSGLPEDLNLSNLSRQLDDLEDDIFGSGGGMEIDPHESLSMSVARMSISDRLVGKGAAPYSMPSGVGAVAGEHPYGEHPSRTLFVRNINSNVEDSELKALFEHYGDIRELYTVCKPRGFVMISYYDIRAARTAMRALQNKPLRWRKLDIHFSIPKDNPSDKDMNQGTLVAFNLDPSVSNDDLLRIFGEYGEVKEIRETPHKRHHKFIEFYDVRAAEAALKALNRRDIAGKRIKLEPSRPGGGRRNFMSHMSQDIYPDETQTFRHLAGSSISSSPTGNLMPFNGVREPSPMHLFGTSPNFRMGSPATTNSLPGPLSLLHPKTVSSLKVSLSPIGKDPRNRGGITDRMFNSPTLKTNPEQSHSFSEPDFNKHFGTSLFETPETNGSSCIGTLSGTEFLWGSPNPRSELSKSPVMQKAFVGNQFVPNEQGLDAYPISAGAASYLSSSLPRHHHLHHVGSAPSGIPLERHIGFPKETLDSSFIRSTYGGLDIGNRDRSYLLNGGAHVALNSSLPYSSYLPEIGSPSLRMMASPRVNHMFLNEGSNPGRTSNRLDNLLERGQNHRGESIGNQINSKKQFQLDLEKIISGEDIRTTLMIKNIPNKYTSKMLLAAIDEKHKETYDFLYLPIDFKNKCNVGYAFINMLTPEHIIPFYQYFNDKRWEKFNSEKVASIAYARIQGKAALVKHFQNSSLMNEDKRCRPIVFNSDGLQGDNQILQVHFPSANSTMQGFQRNASSTSSGLPGSASGFTSGFSKDKN